ncbi:MAG: hypothetical protein ACO39X_04795 [Candidatus Nanopelagicaceae bacterium]
MIRKGLLVLLCTAFLASITSVAHSTYLIPDEIDLSQNIALQTIVDGNIVSTEAHSWVYGVMIPNRQTGKGGSNWVCVNFDDPVCQDKDSIYGQIVLPVCSATVTLSCVEALSIGKDASSLKPAKMQFEGVGLKVPASSKAGIPAGGSLSVWRSEDSGDYIVLAVITYQIPKETGKPFISNFSVNLIPTIYEQNPGYFAPLIFQELDGDYPNISFGNKDPQRRSDLETKNCLVVTDGYCFSREEFKPETRARISLRVPNDVTGWLFGRMKSPVIDVKAIDGSNNLLTVEATNATIPNLIGIYPKSQVRSNPGVLEWAKSFFYEGDGMLEKTLGDRGLFGGHSSGANKLEIFNWWGDELKAYGGPDKRFGSSTRWMFSSTTMGQYSDQCFADRTRLTGLVTTNAPFFESGPPKMVDDVLTYVVAGPHHLGDGKTLFKGVYDLSIRSDAARCIYGFSEAPLRAEISVTSSDGSIQDIATESMTERNGWVYLSAYNFHFSSPTVRVKLLQDSSVSGKVENKSSTPKEGVKSTTVSKKSKKLVCVKGSITKKVTGVNAKCPKGFKKKL